MNTIAAISTGAGTGGIGIIRMSGDKCFEVLKKIFIPFNKELELDNVKGYTIKYGYIINAESKEKIECTGRRASRREVLFMLPFRMRSMPVCYGNR